MTAAHPTYPLGTRVRVTNLEEGGSVEVEITDRGPTEENQAEGVIIDLTRAAANNGDKMSANRLFILRPIQP